MEIERKFLVNKEKWELVNKSAPNRIVQAYLVRTPEKTIRVRIKDEKGFLTIKGPTVGISRSEFEYEIPLNEANELIEQFADKIIEKYRFEIILLRFDRLNCIFLYLNVIYILGDLGQRFLG